MCIFIGDLYLYLYLDLRSSAVSRRRRPQPPSGPVRPRTRPWSLARSIHALGAAAVATRGAPADRRDPLAHPEPPTRRPCRRCALSAGGLVPAGTDRAGAGRRPLRGRCSIAGTGERSCEAPLPLSFSRWAAGESSPIARVFVAAGLIAERAYAARGRNSPMVSPGVRPVLCAARENDMVRKHISHVSTLSRSLWTNVVCVKQGHVPTDACNRVDGRHTSRLSRRSQT